VPAGGLRGVTPANVAALAALFGGPSPWMLELL